MLVANVVMIDSFPESRRALKPVEACSTRKTSLLEKRKHRGFLRTDGEAVERAVVDVDEDV
jgi:hypothetical protein